jgi:alanyl aminopeptidase
VVSGTTIPPNEGRPFPIPLRGIAVKGKGPSLQFALEQTAQYVAALEDYFGIPYPYRKLDLVAVPDFAAGAMENVGLITFREWLLLLDAERATEGQRRAFAYVMAHELAHQWFGNLVTMPWWDDIWLNEAFATWMGNKVVHTLHPEFRSDLARLASTHRAMGQDSLTSARSIRQPILSNHDIKNAFDIITYVKGGAVLSMFEHWMGPDTFREGIRRYLRRHRGGTATSSDLLAALDEVSAQEVTAPFLSFLTQPGVPLLSSTDERSVCQDGARRLTLRQERYFPFGSDGDRAQTWQVPLCVRHEGGSTCGLLEGPEGHIELPGCPTWWMPNEEGAGYFRFSMSEADWDALRKRGLRQLSDGGTIALTDSLYAEHGAGRLETGALLRWFPSFVRSELRQVATGPMRELKFMMADGGSPESRGRITKYSRRLYRKLYQRLGWSSKAGDSSDRKLLREAVIRFMVMDVRERHARSRAVRFGRKLASVDAASDPSIVEPQLAALSIAAAVQEGDEAFFDHLVELLHQSPDATTRNRILVALGHAETEELSEKALGLAFDPKLRRNEIGSTLAVQLRSPRTRDRAWRWLTQHFDALVVRMGSAQAGKLPWYTAGSCSHAVAEEVREFFEPRVSTLAGGPRNLDGAIESISLCAARVNAQRAGIDRAFAATRP